MQSLEDWVGMCSYCFSPSEQQIINAYTYYRDADPTKPAFKGTIYVLDCRECRGILVYHAKFLRASEYFKKDFNLWGMVSLYFDKSDDSSLHLLWPQTKLNQAVPWQVLECYLEAVKVKNISSSSFAVLMRKALEAICNDLSVPGKSLDERLEELTLRGVLPKAISKIASELRRLGNVGAHAYDIQITPKQVQAIDDFFQLVVEYVYVIPNKLEAFRNQLQVRERA
jgi:hypothetical protein